MPNAFSLSGYQTRQASQESIEWAAPSLRPTMMTVLVGTFGLPARRDPHAIGFDSRRPFVIVIAEGLIACLLTSIFLLPALYVWFARASDKLPEPEENFEI
jgi:Cu/Ag efflux pump CusA